RRTRCAAPRRAWWPPTVSCPRRASTMTASATSTSGRSRRGWPSSGPNRSSSRPRRRPTRPRRRWVSPARGATLPGLTPAPPGAADAAGAQVGIARRRLADTELYADAPGVATAVGAEPGEVVQPGRMIVQLARDDGMDAVFDVSAAVIEASPPDPEVSVALS